MSKVQISSTINGETVEFLCEPQQSLMEILREELSRMGTKEGCATGDCGACSVLVDDRLVCSCLVLGVEAQGKEITTIEGIADGLNLTPIQEAMVEHGGLQCGFCTSGMVLTLSAFLAENPKPTREQVRHALSGNLCRCTGYRKIVDAAMHVAEAFSA